MSSFFTLPSSQKKRKRTETTSAPSSKKRAVKSQDLSKSPKAPSRAKRDDSISGSESDHEGLKRVRDGEDISGSDSNLDDETGAERRLRLAEQYLENIKGEVGETVGFDAEQIDKDLIAERLKEDAAESKGRLFRPITPSLSFSIASQTHFRFDPLCVTSITICPPHAYTVSKDLTLIKWLLATPAQTPPPAKKKKKKLLKKALPPQRRRPTQLIYTKGNMNRDNDPTYLHHTSAILTVAASPSGRFIATGGLDKKIIIWAASTLTPIRVFTQHRDSVLSLSFRPDSSEQLYSSSADRTIKIWSLNELAYIETLFGHQDSVISIAALSDERCLSVGSRDRTARLWKVVEETQLVFRGGGGGSGPKLNTTSTSNTHKHPPPQLPGSLDHIIALDNSTFLTASDTGTLSIWSHTKKKPIFSLPYAHGLDPALSPTEASAEELPKSQLVCGPPLPRWITALAGVPGTDLVLSGSWDGWVRVWRVGKDRRKIEVVGVVGGLEDTDGQVGGENEDGKGNVRGIINDISVFERGEKGKDGLCIVAAVGTEHRLGRWKKVKGKNGAVVFEVPRLVEKGGEEAQNEDDGDVMADN